jgi:hypothetical protein
MGQVGKNIKLYNLFVNDNEHVNNTINNQLICFSDWMITVTI